MKKVLDLLEKVQTFLGSAALTVFIVLTAYQIISRITGTNAAFTEEISNYAFIWSVFIGTSIMLRKNEHFRFTAISSKLKGRLYFINELAVQVLLLIFSIIMSVHGVELTMKFWSWRMSSISSISLGWAWLSLPICGITSVLYSIENIVNFIKDPESFRPIEDYTEEGVN